MSIISEKFHAQFVRVQEQFDEWTATDQFSALLGLSRKLQISHRYFLSQLLAQNNNQSENNEMFHHMIHQANTPGKKPIIVIISSKTLFFSLFFYSNSRLSSLGSIG